MHTGLYYACIYRVSSMHTGLYYAYMYRVSNMHTGLHYTCMCIYRVLRMHVHIQGVDWWSFGTLVFEMLTGMLSPAPA
mgnify:CR=1 FL=1